MITLRVTRLAGRYEGVRLPRAISGVLPQNDREVTVEQDGQYTKIVALDTSAVVASGHGLQSACKELSEMFGTAVQALDHDGRRMFIVGR